MDTQTHTQTDPDEYPIAVFAKDNYSQTSFIRHCLFLTVLVRIVRFPDCQISLNMTGHYHGYVVILRLYCILSRTSMHNLLKVYSTCMGSPENSFINNLLEL